MSSAPPSSPPPLRPLVFTHRLKDEDIVIVINFTFKGGVGKSTIIHHLSSVLAHLTQQFSRNGKSHRVLIIDLDAQANTSQAHLEDDLHVVRKLQAELAAHNEAKAAGEVDYINHNPHHFPRIDGYDLPSDFAEYDSYTEPHKTNVHSIMSRLWHGDNLPLTEDGADIDIAKFSANLDIQRLNTHDEEQEVFLLSGNTQIIEAEVEWDRNAERRHETLRKFGGCRKIIKAVARSIDARIVVIDVSPSFGNLNKLAVLSSDIVLPPVFADISCCQTVQRLFGVLIPKWFLWRREYLEWENTQQNHPHYKCFRFNRNLPQFFPLLVNNFKLDYTSSSASTPLGQQPLRIHSYEAAYINRMQMIMEGKIPPLIPPEVRAQFIAFGTPTRPQFIVPLIPEIGKLVRSSHRFYGSCVLYWERHHIKDDADIYGDDELWHSIEKGRETMEQLVRIILSFSVKISERNRVVDTVIPDTLSLVSGTSAASSEEEVEIEQGIQFNALSPSPPLVIVAEDTDDEEWIMQRPKPKRQKTKTKDRFLFS